MSAHIASLAYAHGKPTITGILKENPDDFIVIENLSFDPSGEGEHLFLNIQKTNKNTLEVSDLLAKHFKVHPKNIAYAGLKDKCAVTSQWFSLPFPIKSKPDIQGLETESIKVIQSTRNIKKLKRGSILNNHFEIVLRDIQGNLSTLEHKVEQINQKGVPNYFGAQRFGKNENNLISAKKLFNNNIKCSRSQKSLYLSAARSFLFNEIVSKRIVDNVWDTVIEGDIATLNSSRSFFNIDSMDQKVQQRLKAGDIHLSAPLWGQGEAISKDNAFKLEQTVIQRNPIYSNGLENAGLQQDRRAMRLLIPDLKYRIADSNVTFSFSLSSGAYATSVIRELVLT